MSSFHGAECTRAGTSQPGGHSPAYLIVDPVSRGPGAKKGKALCFFQSAEKFKSRYSTLGFSDQPNLDDGAMWPTSFALKKLTAAEEKKIAALVKQAVS